MRCLRSRAAPRRARPKGSDHRPRARSPRHGLARNQNWAESKVLITQISIAARMMVWVFAQLECGPAKVQKRVSFRRATFGARGQQGMRTFRGPEEDLDGNFDVGPTPDAQEDDPPRLGLIPDPEGRPQSRSSAGGCFQRHLLRCHNLPQVSI